MMDADKIFGKMDPRNLGFNLKDVFGDAALKYRGYQQRMERYEQQRGSSVNWNDEKEWATPIPNSKYCSNPNISNDMRISKFSPYQTSKILQQKAQS